MSQGCSEELLEISNIPSELRSADLRAFFSEWVEGGRFLCFHYTHRRSPSASVIPTRCCLVKVRQSDGEALIARFSGQRWIRVRKIVGDIELADRCLVARAAPLLRATAAGDGDGYLTRKQRREMRREGLLKLRDAVVPKDLLPPPAMPQGNVGTPSRRLIELVRECAVPAVALKGLGVCLSGCGRRKERQGEFYFSWGVIGESNNDSGEEWDRFEALEGPVPAHINERADRLECEATLFEEECEQTWEKGSSGLVFHTDDAFWDAAKGDFHERTADALDVVPEDADVQCDWEASTVDPDAAAFQEGSSHANAPTRRRRVDQPAKVMKLPPAIRPRKLHRRQGCCTDSLAAAVSGVPSDADAAVSRARSVCDGVAAELPSVQLNVGTCAVVRNADAFDRDVQCGVAGKLCRKMGWKPGDGLGVKGDLGIVEGLVRSWNSTNGAGMPVKSLKESRRGIGFGGRREWGSGSPDESDLDTSTAPDERAQSASTGREAQPSSTRGGPRFAFSRYRYDDDIEGPVRAAAPDEDYLQIGCIYDKDAMKLRKMQEERATRSGRPWLGAFCTSTMQQDGTEEQGTGLPWWEESEGEGSSVGRDALSAKRQRLMRSQLEKIVFRQAGGLRPSNGST